MHGHVSHELNILRNYLQLLYIYGSDDSLKIVA